MNDAIRLYIVTDDPEKAALAQLGLSLTMVPAFIRIVTEPRDIAILPENACCIGRWFAWSDRRPSAAMLAWLERKERGDDLGVTRAFLDNLDTWLAKRAEAERRLAFGETVVGAIIPAEPASVSMVGAIPPAAQPAQKRWF